MNQGDVYWYTFRTLDKRRPVLILTRPSAISYLAGIMVMPLTTNIRGIPTEVVLTPEQDGVPETCVANADDIQTVQRANLESFITRLSREKMQQVRAAIEFALGFDGLL